MADGNIVSSRRFPRVATSVLSESNGALFVRMSTKSRTSPSCCWFAERRNSPVQRPVRRSSSNRKSVCVSANLGSVGAELFIALEKQIHEGALIYLVACRSFVRSCWRELNRHEDSRFIDRHGLLTRNVSRCCRRVIEF